MDRTPLLSAALLVALGGLSLGCQPDTTWRPAFEAREHGWLMNVWGPEEGARIAVGGSLAGGGRAVHQDGETWSERPVPDGVSLLNWVHGFGPDQAWAVGADGAILAWDGAAWTAMESPTTQDLWGVWGAAPDDLWAVGGTARMPPIAAPTIVHFDGTAWTVVEGPTLAREGVAAFFKVWGSGADDVYVVGDRGVVVHWDGAAWGELDVGAEDDLVAVWGTGPDDVVAVGGRSSAVVSRWDGSAWRTESLAPLPGLNGVWLREPGIAHLAGNRGTLATLDLATFTLTEEPVTEPLDFHAVHGIEGRLVAVGGNLAVPSDAIGTAYTRELAAGE